MLNESPNSRDGRAGDGDPDDIAEFREEIDEVERSLARRIEPGRSGFVIACLAFGLIVALMLPWTGEFAGWQVLMGEDGALPQLFAVTSSLFGIALSALTLITRWWWLSWICAVGSCIATVDGLLAVWSLQSSGVPGHPGAGPGAGLIMALVLVIVLASNWLRTALSRP